MPNADLASVKIVHSCMSQTIQMTSQAYARVVTAERRRYGRQRIGETTVIEAETPKHDRPAGKSRNKSLTRSLLRSRRSSVGVNRSEDGFDTLRFEIEAVNGEAIASERASFGHFLPRRLDRQLVDYISNSPFVRAVGDIASAKALRTQPRIVACLSMKELTS